MKLLLFYRIASQFAALASQWGARVAATLARAASLSTNESSIGFHAWFFVGTTAHRSMAVVNNHKPSTPTQYPRQIPMSGQRRW